MTMTTKNLMTVVASKAKRRRLKIVMMRMIEITNFLSLSYSSSLFNSVDGREKEEETEDHGHCEIHRSISKKY